MTIDELIAHYRELRDRMLSDIADMESGRWRLHEMRGNERVDITPQWIEEQKRRAESLERIIAAYAQRAKEAD